jgi:hypothetical protein
MQILNITQNPKEIKIKLKGHCHEKNGYALSN